VVGVDAPLRYERAMKFQTRLHVILFSAVVSFITGCGKENTSASAADPAPAQRTAEDLMGGVRLKQLTRTLELTDEQQGKVKTVIDGETKKIAQINEDVNLPAAERASRIAELKQDTYGKIKPLLTPAQLEKFEQMLTKPQKRKKT
jgi:hypothetical protein